MSQSDSDISRTDPDFGWVSDLPTYTGLLPISTSSLLPKFSLFSLFRSSRPSLPTAEQLEPLFALPLHPANPPSAREAIKALTALSEYVSRLQTSCTTLDESKAEEAEQWVLRAMEGYMLAIAIVSHLTFHSEGADTAGLGATIPQSLRGVFTIYAHYVGSSRPAVTSWLDKITANLLAALHSPQEGDEGRRYLVPLFSQTREIIRSLQHAVRASHTKSAGPGMADDVEAWEGRAGERMEWLRLLADHVRGLGGLEVIQAEVGKAKKPTKKAMLAAEKEAQERPMRIALEADLLRCDLAISMATAKIGDVKRRARAQLMVAGAGGEEVKGEEVKDEEGSRKRRALTDESDLGTIVDQAEWEPLHLAETGTEGRKWEMDIEVALLETLRKVREVLEERHSEVLVAKIERSDWLDDLTSTKGHGGSSSKLKSISPDGVDVDDLPESPSSSSPSEDSDSSEDDLSHSCPLRTLFRLHDRYEEQRLAVWLSLPSEERGKMGAYMRGIEGRVGAAWDAVGLRLLGEFDSDSLEAYGLSPDKHDKWVELSSRKNGKKIRKKGRKTV